MKFKIICYRGILTKNLKTLANSVLVRLNYIKLFTIPYTGNIELNRRKWGHWAQLGDELTSCMRLASATNHHLLSVLGSASFFYYIPRVSVPIRTTIVRVKTHPSFLQLKLLKVSNGFHTVKVTVLAILYFFLVGKEKMFS